MDSEKIKDLLEKRLVLLEDEDEDDSDNTDDSSGGDDEDTDEDDESTPTLDLSTKNDIRIIKNTIDLLIKINMFMLSIHNVEFYNINSLVFKIRYSFIIFVKNFESYSDKEQKTIIKTFKITLQQIIQEINKNL